MFRALAAATLAVVVGCGRNPQEPPRVLAPSIRTLDLVLWINEGGIEANSIDWRAIDEAHDRYLTRVLSDRIVARDRITQLYSPIDDLVPPDPSERERWNIARASANTSRDFNAILTRHDEVFLNELADARGMNHEISGYLIARRRLDRVADRFTLAQSQTTATKRFPNPIDVVLAEMLKTPSADPIAVRAFAVRTTERLAPIADNWWENTVKASLLILEGFIPPSAQTPPNEAEAERNKLNASASLIVTVTAQEYIRAALELLASEASTPTSSLTTRAITRGIDEVLDALARPGAVADLDHAFANARSLSTAPEATRRQVERLQAQWRNEWTEILRAPDSAVTTKITERSVAAAETMKDRLLALFPAVADKNLILLLPTRELQFEPSPEDSIEEDEGYTGFSKATSWVRAGVIPPLPTRDELRTIARLANLDRAQEDLFIDDARTAWKDFLATQEVEIGEVEAEVGRSLESVQDPAVAKRLIALVLKSCVDGPTAQARVIDDGIARRLVLLAENFHGKPEPAATIWRIFRALPPPPPLSWGRSSHNEVRGIGAVTAGSAAQLAIDRELSPTTREVLVDLLRERAAALISAADSARAARSTFIVDAALALVEGQGDPARALEKLREVSLALESASAPWTTLQDEIIDSACDLLDAQECERLRYRRAELRFPELFLLDTADFAVDSLAARREAGEALAANDSALELALRADDLALLTDIKLALAKRPGSQLSNAELMRLALTDESLVEKSKRRIDRAVRARRDLDLRPTASLKPATP